MVMDSKGWYNTAIKRFIEPFSKVAKLQSFYLVDYMGLKIF